MSCEHFTINIGNQEVTDVYSDLISLEVEFDEELAAMFRLKLAIARQPDGTWTYLDDGQFQVWQPVTIAAGLDNGTEELISGYITHIKPSFAADITQCTLEIWGMDSSVLMDREEKLKDWINKKDSDIAAEIFSQYGLTPTVEDTVVIHDERISTTIQRETDIQFLRRLALRNGFECYVEGTTGYFRSPQLNAPPQPVLAAHFGEETNVQNVALEVNVLTPANVAMFQVEYATKEVLQATTEASQLALLGKTSATDLLAAGMSPGVVVVGSEIATGQLEMTTLCQGLYDQGNWFVTGTGEVVANDYGHVLRARQTVPIKGIGETYSGVYYVTHVTHSLTPESYKQVFRVKRNGILPIGTEAFSV